MGGLTELSGWGRFPRVAQAVRELAWRTELPDWPALRAAKQTVLPIGCGRSYGDQGLNREGWVLRTRGLDRFMEFDSEGGVLHAEAGCSLQEIIGVLAPRGWFPPVCPGTQHVTLAGAIANDVHGKNHHRAGSFGHFVEEIELARSDGQVLRCSRTRNAPLFAATIGGLGLTGLILSARVQLKPIPGLWMEQEAVPFRTVEEFLALSKAAEPSWEYSVAWLDLAKKGETGIFFRGNHSSSDRPAPCHRAGSNVPVDLPPGMICNPGVRIFNRLYAWRQRSRRRSVIPLGAFFFPLDALQNWNRLYGKPGFLQYQFVVPTPESVAVIQAVSSELRRARVPLPLTVLKVFGERPSEGLLSFPRPGVTLAVDMPNRGPEMLKALDRCDRLVAEAGGALYPAKDARMSQRTFTASFPRLGEFQAWRDPLCESDLWRRVTA